MPNHIHGIIVITGDVGRGTAVTAAGDDPFKTSRAPTPEQFSRPVTGSIPTIIRSYKSAVTLRINYLRGVMDPPIWLRNYYEHILRGERDYLSIYNYIFSNPGNWEYDPEHT